MVWWFVGFCLVFLILVLVELCLSFGVIGFAGSSSWVWILSIVLLMGMRCFVGFVLDFDGCYSWLLWMDW